MKKIDERVLKYLSGLYPEEEKRKFELDLQNSMQLRDALEEARAMLAEFGNISEIAIDERYFIDLLPAFRSKQNNKTVFRFRKIAYAVPVAIAIIIALIFLPGRDFTIDEQSNILVQAIMENADKEEISEKLSNDLALEPVLPFELAEANSVPVERSTIPESDMILSISELALLNYESLENLSDEELEIVYNKLSMILL